MSWVIMPFIACPRNAQYKMYGEICYTWSVEAIMKSQNFCELDFFWHHCTRRVAPNLESYHRLEVGGTR